MCSCFLIQSQSILFSMLSPKMKVALIFYNYVLFPKTGGKPSKVVTKNGNNNNSRSAWHGIRSAATSIELKLRGIYTKRPNHYDETWEYVLGLYSDKDNKSQQLSHYPQRHPSSSGARVVSVEATTPFSDEPWYQRQRCRDESVRHDQTFNENMQKQTMIAY